MATNPSEKGKLLDIRYEADGSMTLVVELENGRVDEFRGCRITAEHREYDKTTLQMSQDSDIKFEPVEFITLPPPCPCCSYEDDPTKKENP